MKGLVEYISESLNEELNPEELKVGDVITAGTFNNFKIGGVEGEGKRKRFTGELMDKKGKVVSKSSTISFDNFSNPHYSKNYNIVNEGKKKSTY